MRERNNGFSTCALYGTHTVLRTWGTAQARAPQHHTNLPLSCAVHVKYAHRLAHCAALTTHTTMHGALHVPYQTALPFTFVLAGPPTPAATSIPTHGTSGHPGAGRPGLGL